ncbi:MAG: hypothetical protein ACXVGK_11210 [Mycobacteriaceae bacterium]
MSAEPSSDLVAALTAVGERLRRIVPVGGRTEPVLEVADLPGLGGALDEVTRALASIALSCAAQVGQFPFAHVLCDDDSTHSPAARCDEAADHLHQVAHHLADATLAAWQFHNTVSHITVEVKQGPE